MKRIACFLHAPDGATAIEYCIIAGLISIAIVAGVTMVGSNLESVFFNNLANAVP